MNPERWPQVKQLFEEAIAFDVAKRPSFLATVCNGDPELLREIESLLASHDQAGTGFLKNPAVDFKSAVFSSPSQPGQRIGVYQIGEAIGEGGMGEVYRATRVDGQYTKEVAIKLVRRGFDSKFLQERFRNERQILATLDHPNIARLLDGGTTEDGIPYLVMELIEGVRIDSYCEAHQVSIPEILNLFRQVCGAVQYAHQRLVIHRDIKPGNILVTEQGVPKLLDFGIAKILDPAGGAETTLGRPMTPEFASPEQILGLPITTASDVYSLGVLLYLLLTGLSPYSRETSSDHELAKAICERDPLRPSTAVSHQRRHSSERPVTPPSLQVREGSPAKLRRRLAGDLDDIVLKALRKEPARRYSSAEQFSDDIRRHQEGLPVTAARGSWSYRAGKFARRHRVGIAAAAIVALALISGIAATLRQMRIAQVERARAEKRFNDVRQLSNSLIFEIHDSIQSLPGATPSRKLLLDRAVEYLDKLSQDSAGDIDLQRELAWGYQRLATVQGDTTQSNLGQVSAAEVSNKKATALFEAVAKANPHSLNDQLNLAMAYRWRGFFDIYETVGRAEINRALAVTEPLFRSHGDNLAVLAERAEEEEILANNQDAMGDRMQSIDSFLEVSELRQRILAAKADFPGMRSAVLKTKTFLAYQIGRFGSREEAVALFNSVLADYEALAKASGGDPAVIRDWSSAEGRLGEVQIVRGDVAAAHDRLRRARHRVERLARLDPENKTLQSDLWIGEFNEGRALAVGGKYAASLPVLQHAYQGYESLHLEADVGPGPSSMEAWIGEALAATGHFNEALKIDQKAEEELAKDRDNYDDARCDLAMVETKIGNLLVHLGRLEEAASMYKKASEVANLNFSLEHKDISSLYAEAEAEAGLGDVAAEQAQKARDAAVRSKLVADARNYYENSLKVWQRIPYPARFDSNGYLARDPHQISQRLEALPR